MPCLIRILRGDTLYPTDYQADSLADAVKFEPQDGIYTVANTFHTTKTLKLDAHLDRMEDSARRVGIPLTLNRDGLRLALRNMILEADYGDVRFRVTVPHDASHVILSIEPFTPLTPEFLAKGVRALTVQDSARDQAAAKTTDWMHKRKQIAEALPDGVSEAILLDAEGNLLETLGANFYAILGGELRTAGMGVLGGISQSIVFEIAPDRLPVVTVPIHVSDIPQVEEAFITSSSRGIVPVVEIDGHVFGEGSPRAMTQTLMKRYDAWVNEHLEDL